MNVFDYMSMVSGYMINKLENKKDINYKLEFIVTPKHDINTDELYYEIKEVKDSSEELFFIKVPCANKLEFFQSITKVLLQYLRNCDLVAYTATQKGLVNKMVVETNNRVSFSLIAEDLVDFEVFKMLKESMDRYIVNQQLVVTNEEENEIVIDEFEEEQTDEVLTYSKIRL